MYAIGTFSQEIQFKIACVRVYRNADTSIICTNKIVTFINEPYWIINEDITGAHIGIGH